MGDEDRENSGLDTKRKHRCIYLCLVKRRLHIRIAIQYRSASVLSLLVFLNVCKKVQRNLP